MEFLAINKSVTPSKVLKLNASNVNDVIEELNKKGILDFDLYLNIKDEDLFNTKQRLEQLEKTVLALQSQLEEKETNTNEVPKSSFTFNHELNNQERPPKQNSKFVRVELLDKKLLKAKPMSGQYEDKMFFQLKLHNLTAKHMRAVKGDIVFSDLFGADIFRVSVTINQKISPQSSTDWAGEMVYNQFMPDHVHFAGFKKPDLKVRLDDESIVYA